MRNTRAGRYMQGRTQQAMLIPPETWEQEKANRRKERKFRKGRKRFKHFRRR